MGKPRKLGVKASSHISWFTELGCFDTADCKDKSTGQFLSYRKGKEWKSKLQPAFLILWGSWGRKGWVTPLQTVTLFSLSHNHNCAAYPHRPLLKSWHNRWTVFWALPHRHDHQVWAGKAFTDKVSKQNLALNLAISESRSLWLLSTVHLASKKRSWDLWLLVTFSPRATETRFSWKSI